MDCGDPRDGGEPSAARSVLGSQQHDATIRTDAPAVESSGDFLGANGWKRKREKAIFDCGGRASMRRLKDRCKQPIHLLINLRYIRQPKIKPSMNKTG